MMDGKVEREVAERDGEVCGCNGGPSLEVLKEVQRAYEHRMEMIDRSGGSNKMQKQVQLLKSWVSDLMGQNALLVHTVEDLEAEITTRLLLERRRHAEMQCEVRAEAAALRRRLARKDADLRGLLELLSRLRDPHHPPRPIGNIHFYEVTESDIFGNDFRQENQLEQGDTKHNKSHQDKTRLMEIRRLNKDLHQHEQTILSLRKEMSLNKYHTPDVTQADAEVTADICCPGIQMGDMKPEKDYTCMLRQETAMYQERLQQMEKSVETSAKSMRVLHETNVSLNKEILTLQQMCDALGERCHVYAERACFRDDLMREMRRQLRQAKTKLKEVTEATRLRATKETGSNHEVSRHSVSYDSLASCVSQQPRRSRRVDLENWDCGTSTCREYGVEGNGDARAK